MPEFLRLSPPPEALALFLAHIEARPEPEWIALSQALGRVTAAALQSPHALPQFPRSTVDGYALRAGDTYGCSESLPAYLTLVGEVPMGDAPAFSLSPGVGALIHTGGMLPAGADAVVMVEYTQRACANEIEILRPVALGENVIKVGEDVLAGDEVIPRGARLRPAELGGAAALGFERVCVARRPTVGIISTGDEVVPPEALPRPGQVRDVNTIALSALVAEAGGLPVSYGIIPDQSEALYAAAAQAHTACDLTVITAGSSASARDLTAEVINRLGKPGVLVHGVAVRPGKPTILAVCDRKAVIGLPGNPVSALVIANLFVKPVIEALLGLQPRPRPQVWARLSVNLPSQTGREDWVPVRLRPGMDGLLAEPVFGKSNLIFTLARADGLVRVDPDATGLAAGEMAPVFLY